MCGWIVFGLLVDILLGVCCMVLGCVRGVVIVSWCCGVSGFGIEVIVLVMVCGVGVWCVDYD